MPKTLGLALGSGGARGWAHIGVIRALQEADVAISAIAGASIGAFVGAIYAAGELDELEALVRDLDWRSIVSYFDLVFPASGLLDGNKVYELLSEHLQNLCIEDASIPFCCIATDLITGQEVCLSHGSMADAVRASISIPGIFTPFSKDSTFLGDGGIVNPVPVDAIRRMGVDVVLAVNLNRPTATVDGSETLENSARKATDSQKSAEGEDPSASDRSEDSPADDAEEKNRDRIALPDSASSLIQRLRSRYEAMQETVQAKLEGWLPAEKSGPNIFDVIGISLNVMEQRVTQSQLAQYPPDILLEPTLCHYSIFDFHQAADIIECGYQATQQQLPALLQLLAAD